MHRVIQPALIVALQEGEVRQDGLVPVLFDRVGHERLAQSGGVLACAPGVVEHVVVLDTQQYVAAQEDQQLGAESSGCNSRTRMCWMGLDRMIVMIGCETVMCKTHEPRATLIP